MIIASQAFGAPLIHQLNVDCNSLDRFTGKAVGVKQTTSQPPSLNKCQDTAALPEQNSLSSLKVGVGIKAGEESCYTCGDCGKAFRRKSYLLQHAATKHTKTSSIKNCQAVVSSRTPPPPYEPYRENRNDQTISSSQNKFDGLAALAYAAEVHSRLFTKFEPIMQNDKRKRVAEDWHDVIPMKCYKKQFAESAYSKFWLPPSPPRSDVSASPLSVASDDTQSPKSNELDAIVSPQGYQNSAMYQTINASPANNVSKHADSVSFISMKQRLQFSDSSAILRNAVVPKFGFNLLRQPPIWNPLYL